jgi:uncharacterized protein (TIGR00369 family)
VSSRTYGVVAPDVLKSYGGLDFLKAIIDGTVPNPPISELMGFHLVEAEEGRAVFEGLPEFRHYNPIATVHGGFAATLLDSALGCAIFSTIAKGDAWTTLELKFNLVRPLTKDTGLVRAEGRLVHRGPHGRNFRRRSQGPRGQALRARHDDVHDLPRERVKSQFLLSAVSDGRNPSGCPAAERCRLCATSVRPPCRVNSQ